MIHCLFKQLLCSELNLCPWEEWFTWMSSSNCTVRITTIKLVSLPLLWLQPHLETVLNGLPPSQLQQTHEDIKILCPYIHCSLFIGVQRLVESGDVNRWTKQCSNLRFSTQVSAEYQPSSTTYQWFIWSQAIEFGVSVPLNETSKQKLKVLYHLETSWFVANCFYGVSLT